jgi:hypothetical protein
MPKSSRWICHATAPAFAFRARLWRRNGVPVGAICSPNDQNYWPLIFFHAGATLCPAGRSVEKELLKKKKPQFATFANGALIAPRDYVHLAPLASLIFHLVPDSELDVTPSKTKLSGECNTRTDSRKPRTD